MKIGNLLLKPSHWREPEYRSDKPAATYSWKCPSCGRQVIKAFEEILKENFGTLGSPFTKEEIEEVSRFFDIGYVGKSHDGGWPWFSKVTCSGCGSEFVFYAGVREASNSFYLITAQGIATIVEESPTKP